MNLTKEKFEEYSDCARTTKDDEIIDNLITINKSVWDINNLKVSGLSKWGKQNLLPTLTKDLLENASIKQEHLSKMYAEAIDLYERTFGRFKELVKEDINEIYIRARNDNFTLYRQIEATFPNVKKLKKVTEIFG